MAKKTKHGEPSARPNTKPAKRRRLPKPKSEDDMKVVSFEDFMGALMKVPREHEQNGD